MPHTVVQLTSHTPDGDTMHRLTWPMQALASLPEFRVIDVHYLSPYSYQLAFEADLLVMCNFGDMEIVPIMRWRKAKGKLTVFEVNDYFFDAHPWNPVFEAWNSPANQSSYVYMMEVADLVQTSTSFLAQAFEPHSSRVVVFANQLAEVSGSLSARGEGPLVVGWAGSIGHMGDLACIAPGVSKWIIEHEDAVLWIMGSREIADLFTVPPERKRFVQSDSMDAYQKFLGGVDIGLAPLRDTPYNRGRSDVKWLEYAANGCVFVGQRLAPYENSVEDGKTGFLFDGTVELVRILDKLYRDRDLMESVRQAAFEYVASHRRYKDHVGERAEVYKELLNRKPPEGGERWRLDEQSRFPRINLPDPVPDYFPVKLDGDEEKAARELYSLRPNISQDSIRMIEERYGDFHLTNYARGFMAFARRDLSAAEWHLQRALSFYPAAVESLRLLGQVLLGMNRLQEAREMFSNAVRWHRGYVLGYRCLVNAAEGESDWGTAIEAAGEWEKYCSDDPWARLIRGYLLIRAGRGQEGMDVVSDVMSRFKERLSYWQVPFAAELVEVLRKADALMSGDPKWSDLILEAAEMFPHGLWLAARAGTICFERGDYKRGERILQRAREQLLAWEWQRLEGAGPPQQYRGRIEAYRTACEEFAQ